MQTIYKNIYNIQNKVLDTTFKATLFNFHFYNFAYKNNNKYPKDIQCLQKVYHISLFF